MGIFVRAMAAPFKLFNAISDEVAKERRLRLTDGLAWSQFAGRESSSGKVVTIDNAMQLATVWACIKLNAQAVSSLPLHMFEPSRRESARPAACRGATRRPSAARAFLQ